MLLQLLAWYTESQLRGRGGDGFETDGYGQGWAWKLRVRGGDGFETDGYGRDGPGSYGYGAGMGLKLTDTDRDAGMGLGVTGTGRGRVWKRWGWAGFGFDICPRAVLYISSIKRCLLKCVCLEGEKLQEVCNDISTRS